MAAATLPGNKAPKTPQPAKKAGRPKKTSFICCSCGAEYPVQDKNFLTSSSSLFAANNGYVPICKTCSEKYFATELLPALDYDEKRAVEMMCGLFDWYFSEDALAMSKKTQESQGCGVLSSIYAGRRRLRNVACHGTTYLDTIRQRREAAMRITDMKEASGDSLDPDANHAEVDPDTIHMFGLGYSPEEYAFLKEQYDDWTTRYECNTKAMEECMKALCVAQLNTRRAQQRGDTKGTTDAMKSFQDLLSTAKLSPRQSKEDKIGETETFGTLLKKWEDEKPIPEPSAEFADVDNMRNLVSTWFFGHLAKMFNIKNDLADLYEQEAAKYTVMPPVYDEEEQDAYSDIDAMFGSAKRAAERPGE